MGLGSGSQSVCWGEALSEDIYARHARCRAKSFLESLRALLEGTSR
ncbi:hypothetical protein [Pendulispora albinea]|uniref:Uncharacterized protein n=1 Tax=Pendulispora albinea TaxID=2741071 RepID=A0ABZ2M9R9_9BACT